MDEIREEQARVDNLMEHIKDAARYQANAIYQPNKFMQFVEKSPPLTKLQRLNRAADRASHSLRGKIYQWIRGWEFHDED